jgi:hypothetical protein
MISGFGVAPSVSPYIPGTLSCPPGQQVVYVGTTPTCSATPGAASSWNQDVVQQQQQQVALDNAVPWWVWAIGALLILR